VKNKSRPRGREAFWSAAIYRRFAFAERHMPFEKRCSSTRSPDASRSWLTHDGRDTAGRI